MKDALAKQGNAINIAASAQAIPFFRSELARYTRLAKKISLEAQ